jgi:hypothetical protein
VASTQIPTPEETQRSVPVPGTVAREGSDTDAAAFYRAQEDAAADSRAYFRARQRRQSG